MTEHSDTSRAAAAACAFDQERAAWAKIQGRLPGTPDFCESDWQSWRTAVEQADSAFQDMASPRDAAAQGTAGSQHTGGFLSHLPRAVVRVFASHARRDASGKER